MTTGRALALGLLFAAGAALLHATAGSSDGIQRVLDGVVAGVGAVAVGGLLVLAFDYGRAVEPATTVLPARYQGLGGGPNTAMMVLAVGLPLVAHALLEARRPRERVLLALLALVVVGSIVASGSRGALGSGFLGLLAYMVLRARGLRARAVAAAGIAALFAVALLLSRIPQPHPDEPVPAAAIRSDEVVAPSRPPPGSPFVDPRLVPRLQDEVGQPPIGVGDTKRRSRTVLGTSGRVEAWRGALQQFAERPLLGFGFGTEDKVFVDRYVGFNSNVPENSYLGLLLQLGALGLLTFLVLVGMLVRPAVTALRRLSGRELRLAAACAGAVAVGVALACFQSYVYAAGNNATAAVWISAFLLAAVGADQGQRVAVVKR